MLTHTAQWVFDLKDDDVYWCTADIGWITGHSYILYGPLALGATALMFEGVPTYPAPDRFWQIVREVQGQHLLHRADRHPRPDAGRRRADRKIRSLLACASSARWASRSTRKPGCGTTSNIGKSKLPIVDTWWQTETGGIMISGLALCHPAQARLGHPAAARHRRRHPQRGRQRSRPPTRAAIWSSANLGPACSAASTAIRTATKRPISPATPASTTRKTARERTRTATSGSWAAWTT